MGEKSFSRYNYKHYPNLYIWPWQQKRYARISKKNIRKRVTYLVNYSVMQMISYYSYSERQRECMRVKERERESKKAKPSDL